MESTAVEESRVAAATPRERTKQHSAEKQAWLKTWYENNPGQNIRVAKQAVKKRFGSSLDGSVVGQIQREVYGIKPRYQKRTLAEKTATPDIDHSNGAVFKSKDRGDRKVLKLAWIRGWYIDHPGAAATEGLRASKDAFGSRANSRDAYVIYRELRGLVKDPRRADAGRRGALSERRGIRKQIKDCKLGARMARSLSRGRGQSGMASLQDVKVAVELLKEQVARYTAPIDVLITRDVDGHITASIHVEVRRREEIKV